MIYAKIIGQWMSAEATSIILEAKMRSRIVKIRFSVLFCSLVTLTVWGLFVPASAKAEPITTSSLIMSWNMSSRQFIDPPVFQVLRLPQTEIYRAVVRQGEQSYSVQSSTPTLDLQEIWPKLSEKKFILTLEWLNAEGRIIHSENRKRVKAPDFQGEMEPPLDWAAAADRNIAYLIDACENASVPYREPGVPVWIWAASPGHKLAFPCITIPPVIMGLLAHAENQRPQSQEALRLARVSADWMLKNRQPDSGALPLFPFSTVTFGEFEGHVEGNAVNLLRASWLGSSLVALYAVTKHEPYLEYARHIADTTLKFQAPDGSFPYRVDPVSGAVIEAYSCNAMEFIELVEALEPYGFDADRAMAARRAVDWLITYVCPSNNWKAAYEDVRKQPPFFNLSQMAVLPLIRYLSRHHEEDPAWLPLAQQLNRWVEDQFVTFSTTNEAAPKPALGPLVFEQYTCWYPMEFHTSNWIMALIELHRASGDAQYLQKARAAANAICHAQFTNGEFSTWSRAWPIDHSAEGEATDRKTTNWFNCNAMADVGLYQLADYCRTLP